MGDQRGGSIGDLTVVVPTTGRPTVRRALESILTQTVPTEYVVVSDLELTGAGPAMNRAIAAVTTEYVGFVGDDDRLDTRYHEWWLGENRSADLFIYSMRYQDGTVLPTTTCVDCLQHGIVGGSFIMRTDLAREHPFVLETEARPEDWVMIETLRSHDAKIQVTQTVAYYVRH